MNEPIRKSKTSREKQDKKIQKNKMMIQTWMVVSGVVFLALELVWLFVFRKEVDTAYLKIYALPNVLGVANAIIMQVSLCKIRNFIKSSRELSDKWSYKTFCHHMMFFVLLGLIDLAIFVISICLSNGDYLDSWYVEVGIQTEFILHALATGYYLRLL